MSVTFKDISWKKNKDWTELNKIKFKFIYYNFVQKALLLS